MISAVRSALDSLLGTIATLRSATGMGRIFELFVLTGIAIRLQSHGLDVWLQRSDGTRVEPSDPDRRFIQRGGAPSGVPPAAAGPGYASVIGFTTNGSGSLWEIWNGIQFQGRSGATHEIDIAVVPGEIGNHLRTIGGFPFGRPRVAIECKDVGQPGSPDEMRALVARLYDLTLLQSHHAYVPSPPPLQAIYPGDLPTHGFYRARMTYWNENHHTMNAIARRTGFSQGAVAMTGYYAIEPHGYVTVGSPEADAFLDAVAAWIIGRCP